MPFLSTTPWPTVHTRCAPMQNTHAQRLPAEPLDVESNSGSYPGPSPAIYRAFQTQAPAEDTTIAVVVSSLEATVSNNTGDATQKKCRSAPKTDTQCRVGGWPF